MKTQISHIRSIIAVIFIFAITYSAAGQNMLQKARSLKENLEYAKAIESYKAYFKSNLPDINNAREMAMCYLMLRDTKSAEEWFSKVISFDAYTAEDVCNYAGVLKSNGKYREAILQYEHYAYLVPAMKADADSMILSCKETLEWIADPAYFSVVNAEEFNSPYSDIGLIPFKGGYIFSSDRIGDGMRLADKQIDGCSGNAYYKLYFVKELSEVKNADDSADNIITTNGISSLDQSNSPIALTDLYYDYGSGYSLIPDPLMISELNSTYHNALSTFDKSANTIYFTRTKMDMVQKRPVNNDPTSWYDRSSTGDKTDFLEIYSASYENGKWHDVKPFEFNKPNEYNVCHPAISPDGKVLYFVSDMPGGYGKTDIYYCIKQANGKWDAPRNAGPKINTPGEESFPFVDTDGTFYFSSDGHPGMGGLDIFSARGYNDNWDQPVNLKCPVNSPKDDFSVFFSETGKSGYFSSNRDGGNGEDDIYSFAPEPLKNLVLVVTTKERTEDGKINVLADVMVKIASNLNSLPEVISTGMEGKIISTLDCNIAYELLAAKDGYFAQSKTISTECKTRHDTLFADFILDKIVINKPIVLKNIYYDFDKWYIRPDAAKELDKLVDILKNNPLINIELGSHCDSRGTYAYNDELSQKRAESAVSYIVSKGIDASRISAKGYGKRFLVNNCTDGVSCSEADHQLNRRTEFKVTSIKTK